MEPVNEFKALADQTRLRIINLLSHNDLCVCEITDILSMAQSRVSRHLGILKQAGLIREKRKGKWVVYKISGNDSPLVAYIRSRVERAPVYKSDLTRMRLTLKKGLCPDKGI